jgi:hypothetical protein
MSNTNTGGPAFPFVEPPTAGYSVATGMTLRDYFAAKAMQAVCAPHPTTGQYPQKAEFQWCAETAYALADAMLKAREA